MVAERTRNSHNVQAILPSWSSSLYFDEKSRPQEKTILANDRARVEWWRTKPHSLNFFLSFVFFLTWPLASHHFLPLTLPYSRFLFSRKNLALVMRTPTSAPRGHRPGGPQRVGSRPGGPGRNSLAPRSWISTRCLRWRLLRSRPKLLLLKLGPSVISVPTN